MVVSEAHTFFERVLQHQCVIKRTLKPLGKFNGSTSPPVTASEARQSMNSGGMDCFTTFAMTVISRGDGFFLLCDGDLGGCVLRLSA